VTRAFQEDHGVELRLRALPPRSLGGLLDETFTVYGRYFWRFLVLSAVVQAPLGLISLMAGDGMAFRIAAGLIGLIALVCVDGATIFAVGQQYVIGEIKIGECYSRVMWRGRTIILLTGLFLVALVLAISVVLTIFLAATGPAGATLIAAVVAVPIMAHWAIAVESVTFEGRKTKEALARTFELVSGDRWRAYGTTLVILLVTSGLGILLTLPIGIADRIAAPEQANLLSNAFQIVGGLVVGIIVPPVAFISLALLYYDLRVRKENYDLTAMSREMGIVRA
jgi:hypothetical protein